MRTKSNNADASKLGYIGRQPTAKRNSDTWFTPKKYLDAVRLALGEITLDPFSDEAANQVVGARYFFDEKRDGLTQNWKVEQDVKAFMNPPYSAGLVKVCCTRFITAFQQHEISAGILLVNNATETRWFQGLLAAAGVVCFTDHRISFWNSDGKIISNNTRGQAFFYFGPASQQFIEAFTPHGFCQTLKK